MDKLSSNDYLKLSSKFGQIVGNGVEIKPNYESLKKLSGNERDQALEKENLNVKNFNYLKPNKEMFK